MIEMCRVNLWSVLLLVTLTLTSCSGGDDDIDGASSSSSSSWSDPDGVTEWIDETLCSMYLYNDEYASLTGKNFSDSFDDFFYDNLTRLTTNVLDYKELPEEYGGGMMLFSYIESTDPTGVSRSTSDVANDYGFIHMTPVYVNNSSNNSTFGLYLLALYNDSSAEAVGIRRGMVITSVNGVDITMVNYESYYNSLLYPTAGESVTLELYVSGESSRSYTITTQSYETNPVLRCEVIDEANRVGYLNYVLFNASFDDELLAAFVELESEGVEELILDLRYNLGGYVSSASLMTSAISATSTGSGQVFSYYRLNNSLTEDYNNTKSWTGLRYDSSSSLFYETLSGVSSESQLSHLGSTIYCLVGYNTASASELVINALRGMGYSVVLIGETTRGKNVGMYIFEQSFDGYDYEMAPISFENFNCLQEGGYEAGMEPDYEISVAESLIGCYDFSASEPLISAALSFISGSSPRVGSRSVELSSQGDVVMAGDLETIRPRGVHGALKLAK